MESGGPNPREGDRAIADLLIFDGLAANGGLGHACSVLDQDELRAAIQGFRFFGIDDIAAFLERVSGLPEEQQEEFNYKYYEIVNIGDPVFEKFEAYYEMNAHAFDPISTD